MLSSVPWKVLPICMSPKPNKRASKVAKVVRGVPCIGLSSQCYFTFTCDGVAFQTRSQYSRIERSEENFPMRATLRIDLRDQAIGSPQRALTAFWQSI